MLFNSIEFLFFFITVTTLYFLISHRLRWGLLLGASCLFYMYYKPVYILILGFTIIIDYFAGILIEYEKNPRRKKIFLTVSIISNIGILAVFKYYNFINENISVVSHFLGHENQIPFLNILLPIGLSFHTFQAMSYTFEVYYGRQKAEKHFGIYSLFVMFYPQLVAGPIERPQNILHQFHETKYFSYDNVIKGLNLIAIGLFKKIVVADRLAIYVNSVYGNIGNANTISTLLAVCFFSVQLYCDFSGYSDIALGTAKVMGFNLMKNFNFPFSSKSITEFWRRWHISLSTWFYDYLFTPMVINLRNWGKYGIAYALFITFFLSGLWHGAGWTYIIYGCLHGIALIYEMFTKKARKSISTKVPSLLYNCISRIITFSFVSFSWIFFRSENISKAKMVINKIVSCNFSLKMVQICAEKGPLNLILTFFSLLLLIFISTPDHRKSTVKNVFFLVFITFLIILFGKNETSEFIYFQF
jgi:alginate O-acetyltransferase complex protein AlgI